MNNQSLRTEKLFFVIVILLVAIIAARVPLDSDMWWHLKAGQTTVESGRPTLQDTMSFTRQGEHWVNHSWLTQVFLYLLFEATGFWGLEGYVVLFAVLIVIFIWLQMREPPVMKAFVLLAGAFIFSTVLTPRPQLISLLFLGVTGWYVDVYLNRNYRNAWGLPLIFMLWSNLHAGAVIGMIYLAAYTFGSFLDEVFTKTVERRWKNFWYLCGWASAAVVAVIINPNGLAIYGISFVTVQVKVQQYIQEWLPPDYSEPLQLFFLLFLILTFISIVMSKKRVDFRKLAVLAVFSYLGLTGRRNIALFAVIAIPILGYYLFSFLERIKVWKKATPVNRETIQPKFAKYINFAIVGMLGAIFIIKFYINGNPQIVQRYVENYYPVGQTEALMVKEPEGNLLNEYNWGGYLAWEQDRYPVFIDARTDLYGDVIFEDWLTLILMKDNWDDLLEKYNIGAVMLQVDRPLVEELVLRGWEIVQRDEIGILLIR